LPQPSPQFPQPNPQPIEPAFQSIPAEPSPPQPAENTAPVAETTNSKRLKLPKKKFFIAAGVLILLALLAGGVYAFLTWQAKQRDPVTLLRDGINNSLLVRQVEIGEETPDSSLTSAFDFSTAANPLMSTQGTRKIAGATYGLAGYGSKMNSYSSYTSFPDGVTTQSAATAKNAWVQLKAQGQTPPAADPALVTTADPMYQLIGPVIVGNYPAKARKQLADYLVSQKIYALNSKLAQIDSEAKEKTYILPVSLNVGYLKVSWQSAAASLGLAPADIQSGIDNLAQLKDVKGSLYITAKDHKIVKFTGSNAGSEYTYTYKNYDHASVIAEPETKLTWQTFAALDWQILSQAATRQSGQLLDKQRKAAVDSLHTALASYFTQNNSYPGPASINDSTWLSGLTGVNQTTQRDPLAANLQLPQAPKANTYAYVPVPASGKGPCDGKLVPCVHYKLIATLSNGQQYTVQDP
jgi:hypothetical protein